MSTKNTQRKIVRNNYKETPKLKKRIKWFQRVTWE